MSATALLPAWIGTRRLLPRRASIFFFSFLFLVLVRALCFTYTDRTPMQFASVCVQSVCPPLTVPVWKTKGLVWMAAFSRSHTAAQWVSLMTALLNGYYRGP